MWTVLLVLLFGLALCGAVLFAVALYVQRRPQEVDPKSSFLFVRLGDGANTKLVLPSAPFVTSMKEHVEQRRYKLAALLKASSAEMRKLWNAKAADARLATLLSQRDEVYIDPMLAHHK